MRTLARAVVVSLALAGTAAAQGTPFPQPSPFYAAGPSVPTCAAGSAVTAPGTCSTLTPANIGILSARVTAPVTASGSTVLADVSDLTLTVVAGQKYRYRAFLFMQGDTVGGVKFALSNGTATITDELVAVYANNISAAGVWIINTTFAALATSASATGTGTNNCWVVIDGVIVINAGGTLKFQFAQQAANNSSTLTRGYVELIPTSN